MKYRLKEARTLKGLTLRQASVGLRENGVMWSYQYLGKIENKGVRMDSKLLIKVANFYGVAIDYLIPNPNRPKVEFTEIHFCKMKNNF